MDLQQFITSNNGQTIGNGQCGELVDLYLVDCFNNHTEYSTALDYWTNGIPGFTKTNSPNPGDIACYNQHPGYPDGHIAIYVSPTEVFEQNADPDGSPAHLFNRANTYLLGYLTQGENMNVSVDEAQLIYQFAVPALQPYSSAYTAAMDSFANAWNGKPLDTLLQYIQSNSDIQNARNALLTGGTTPTVLSPGVYKVS